LTARCYTNYPKKKANPQELFVTPKIPRRNIPKMYNRSYVEQCNAQTTMQYFGAGSENQSQSQQPYYILNKVKNGPDEWTLVQPTPPEMETHEMRYFEKHDEYIACSSDCQGNQGCVDMNYVND